MMSRKSMANSAPIYIAPASTTSNHIGSSTTALGVVVGSSTSSNTGVDDGEGGGEGGLTFFEREKERLIEEISGGFEDLMTSTNVLNRKLEEVWGVGKEFETVASLWGSINTLVREKRPDTSRPGDNDQNIVNLTTSLHHQSLGPRATMAAPGDVGSGVPGTGTAHFRRSVNGS